MVLLRRVLLLHILYAASLLLHKHTSIKFRTIKNTRRQSEVSVLENRSQILPCYSVLSTQSYLSYTTKSSSTSTRSFDSLRTVKNQCVWYSNTLSTKALLESYAPVKSPQSSSSAPTHVAPLCLSSDDRPLEENFFPDMEFFPAAWSLELTL